MDIVAVVIVAAVVLVATVASTVLFSRWRRNRYRFSSRAMLVLVTLVGCTTYAVTQFIAPAINHRFAVQRIYNAGGLQFRDDRQPDSGQVYSDPRTANPWRAVAILHARNDAEAITVARQLKYLPETESVFLSSAVTDQGLKAICDSEPTPSFNTLDLLESRVTPNGLSYLAKLTQLRTLFFNTCPLNDACLGQIKTLHTVRNLTLLEESKTGNPNRFTEAGFREIGAMKNLESLWLCQLQISASAADHLKNLTGLRKLKLSRCQIPDGSIAALRQSLPNCRIEIHD